jgi:hypothetical protein
MYISLKTLAFPPAERLWALKPDFHCGGRKKREFAFFSFALGAFAFFRALFFASRSQVRKCKSAKKVPAPTSAKQTLNNNGGYLLPENLANTSPILTVYGFLVLLFSLIACVGIVHLKFN